MKFERKHGGKPFPKAGDKPDHRFNVDFFSNPDSIPYAV
jgi:hypothetical protein